MQKILFKRVLLTALEPVVSIDGLEITIYNPKETIVAPGAEAIIHTGVCVQIPPGCVLYLSPPISSNYLAVIMTKRNLGFVGNTQLEEINVGIKNLSENSLPIPEEQVVAQGVLLPTIPCELLEVSNFPDFWDGMDVEKIKSLVKKI